MYPISISIKIFNVPTTYTLSTNHAPTPLIEGQHRCQTVSILCGTFFIYLFFQKERWVWARRRQGNAIHRRWRAFTRAGPALNEVKRKLVYPIQGPRKWIYELSHSKDWTTWFLMHRLLMPRFLYLRFLSDKTHFCPNSSVQLLSRVRLLETPWTEARQASRPSPPPGVYSNSCALSRWGHPTISSSVVPFSSYP